MVFVIKNKTNVYEKPNWPLKSKQTLAYTKTSREDWELAKIKQKTKMEINQDGRFRFEDYSELDETTPFTDSLNEPKYNFKKTHGVVNPSAKIDATGNITPETNQIQEHIETNCELCGKPIKISHIIICKRRNIWMEIGDICRKTFTDAEDPLEQIGRNTVLTLRKLLIEDGWQSKMINQISVEQVYRKHTEQSGKFYPHKLYADVKKLILELGYLQIPPDDEDPRIIPLDLKESSDEKIIKIWRLARKAFTVKNPTFLNDISDYVNHTRWN